MSYQKFLTENPFRILGIASTTMLPELRRYADVAIRSAEVGIRKVPPLEVEFGPTDFSGLASTVRALGNDPIRRTMHRFLWPDNFGIEVAGNTESLWSNREKLSKLNRQNDFLAPWFNFLLNAYANEATCALKNWHLLLHQEKEIETCSGQRSADFTKVNSRREYQLICVQFAELLVEEDDCARGVATKIVGAACNEISIYLLKRILAEAASKWSTDELQTSMALIKSVLDCPLPKSLKEQCFGQIIEIGDSLSSKIIGGIAELPDFQLGVIPTDRDLVFKLNCLIGVLKTHHPAVNRWQESVEEWTTARVWNMRKSMLKFNEEGDNETALLIVTEALIFAIDSKQRLTLQSDKVALSGYINQANLRKGYEGILPIDCAPSMSTVNGIGCRLYDDGPFPYDKTKHFAILYFTILYIPFLPITRYLVQDVQGNKWKFFGKTKFTAGMKAHVVVASLISLSCIFLIAVSEANKHPVIAQDPTQVSSSGL